MRFSEKPFQTAQNGSVNNATVRDDRELRKFSLKPMYFIFQRRTAEKLWLL